MHFGSRELGRKEPCVGNIVREKQALNSAGGVYVVYRVNTIVYMQPVADIGFGI